MKQIPSQQEIERFLAVNPNNKNYNFGFGFGEGAGYGTNCGKGYGAGNGNDNDNDNDNGNGITFINGYPIHIVDSLFTVFYQIHENYANGAIVNYDLTLTPCFIARVDDCFAHGKTLHDAIRDARAKAFFYAPVETRIQRFVQEYPDPDKPVPLTDLFDWHNILTGSCRLRREQFVEQHQLDTNAEYSPRFFIELTKDIFGGEIIEQLAEAYKNFTNN